jgi:hypothetical protein
MMNGEKLPPREKLMVCYKPWYGPADDALPLVESLIYYRAMGATHFVFLNNRGITPMMVRRVVDPPAPCSPCLPLPASISLCILSRPQSPLLSSCP